MSLEVKNKRFFEYSIYCGPVEEIFNEENKIINTINPHSYCVALSDNNFRQALINSDILVADGYGIKLAMWLKRRKHLPRITGSDIHEKALEKCQKGRLKVFYLGSSEECLKDIVTKLEENYSSIKVKTFSPPFKKEFDSHDSLKMIHEINSFKPDFLFVGMTAPKQEKWVFQHHDKLNVKWICAIGAVFDYYSDRVKRAPLWARKIGIEWIYRSLTSFRLAKRNLISNPRFLLNVIFK